MNEEATHVALYEVRSLWTPFSFFYQKPNDMMNYIFEVGLTGLGSFSMNLFDLVELKKKDHEHWLSNKNMKTTQHLTSDNYMRAASVGQTNAEVTSHSSSLPQEPWRTWTEPSL